VRRIETVRKLLRDSAKRLGKTPFGISAEFENWTNTCGVYLSGVAPGERKPGAWHNLVDSSVKR
jgi:hypothetical protein